MVSHCSFNYYINMFGLFVSENELKQEQVDSYWLMTPNEMTCIWCRIGCWNLVEGNGVEVMNI